MQNRKLSPGQQKPLRDIVWPMVRNCTLWALLHSFMAALPAKRTAERLLGTRKRNGLYRVFFNAQAWVSFIWLVRSLARVPDREVLHVKGVPGTLLLLLRLCAAGLTAWTGLILGPLRFNGVPQIVAYLRGKQPPREDEAQGPVPENGRLKITGPFRLVRHPANLGPFLFALCSRRVTIKGITLTVLLALYGVVGSLHEDYRLGVRYGEEYEQYRHEVPFFMPRITG